jgi:SLOG in TRPM, prokaryote
VAVELVDVEVRGRRIPAARVVGRGDLAVAAARLGLERSPVVVLVGGAAHMAASDTRRVTEALSDAVVPVAERLGAIVVDGATRVGVMKLIGDLRSKAGAGFPLVGVVAAQLVGEAELDERHTHFVLVPGTTWGDESELLSAFAAAAGGSRSVTVLANGGALAWDDAAFSVAEGRRVVVLAGSGRMADELAAAESGRARALHESGLVTVVPVGDAKALATELAGALESYAPPSKGSRRRR